MGEPQREFLVSFPWGCSQGEVFLVKPQREFLLVSSLQGCFQRELLLVSSSQGCFQGEFHLV